MAEFTVSENLKVFGTIKDSADITVTGAPTVEVSKNSAAAVGERRTLNLIEGTNITLTIADDAGGDEIDVTIAAAGGGGLAANTTYEISSWISLSANSSANTYGSYVQLFASVSNATVWVFITFVETTDTTTRATFALAEGAATSEVDKIELGYYQDREISANGLTVRPAMSYSILWEFAATARLSIRAKNQEAAANNYKCQVTLLSP